MKKILFIIIALGTFIEGFSQIDRSKKPAAAPAKEFNLGDYEKFQLDNGLTVIVVENHKIPRISFSLILDRDPILEGDKAGYVSMAGQILRRGTMSRTKAQLDQEVDFIGASLSSSSTGVYGSSLTKHSEKLLDLFADVLFNPSFPADELEKLKKQTVSGLKSGQDDPDVIASNVGSKLRYGSNHPYGEIQLEEHINNISIDDLKSYYNSYFKPNIAYLAVVGDITPKEAKKIVKSRFGSWARGEVTKLSYAQPKQPETTQVSVVNRSSAVQTVLSIGYPIQLKPGSPESIKARVMNQILGGSSAARLFKNIREDKGYTYGAYSSISSDELVGNFNAGASVRNEVTDSAVQEFIYEMTRISQEEVSEEELQLAKNVIIGGFGRSLESAQTIATFAVNIERYNLSEDYYNNYPKNIQSVTIEDVATTAQSLIKPSQMHIVAVGRSEEIAANLEQFGKVTHYDIYGNELDPAKMKLPEGLTAEEVVNKYRTVIGGDKIDEVENVMIKMDAEAMGQALVIDMVMARGFKSNVKVSMGPMVVMAAISDGNDAVQTSMGASQSLSKAQKEELIITNGLFTEFQLLELGAEMNLVGVEQIDGKDAYNVEVVLPSGGSYNMLFDAETGLKIRYTKTLETPQGDFKQQVDYLDYKEVDGILFSHRVLQQMGPQTIEATANEVKLNVELPENTFEIN